MEGVHVLGAILTLGNMNQVIAEHCDNQRAIASALDSSTAEGKGEDDGEMDFGVQWCMLEGVASVDL